jgi:DNA-binding NarL/FixJ family response regulator
MSSLAIEPIIVGQTAPINVLVVDDHPMFRQAVHMALRHAPEPVQVNEVSCFDEALAWLAQADPVELALLDYHLPDVHGYEGLLALIERLPEVPVVVMSAQANLEVMAQCIELGAAGFIPKTLAAHEFAAAVQYVAQGGTYLPKTAMQGLAQRQLKPTTAQPAINEQTHRNAPSAYRLTPNQSNYPQGLTDRQIEVLDLLLQGCSNKIICRRLRLAEGTVKVHIGAVFRALGVHNRTQAVLAAVKRGITAPLLR